MPGRNGNELGKMMLAPHQVEPLWKFVRGYLEKVLVQYTFFTIPDLYHQRGRPSKDYISCFDNVLGFDLARRPI